VKSAWPNRIIEIVQPGLSKVRRNETEFQTAFSLVKTEVGVPLAPPG